MGNACGAASQSNCLPRLKQEYKQVQNRIKVLRSKIEILNRNEMVHDAYIKNSELSGLQEQEKQLANAIALVKNMQQKQASLQRQEFVLTSLHIAQKEILRLDLKNINLNHLLQDQQKIEEAVKKMEDTLSSFNDCMGMQAPKSGQGNQNQEQSFLIKISTAFNRFEEVIQSLKRQLATQEERSSHLGNLFENEKKEKQDKIKMYEIQIENIHENQLKTAKRQIHDLERKLDDNIQESKTIIDELKKQNKNFQDENSRLTVEKMGLANQISQLQTDLSSNQQSLSQKNIESDCLKNKIQDLEKERRNAENKYEQFNNQHNLQKGQLHQLEKKSHQLETEIQSQQQIISQKNIQCDILNNKIKDLEKEKINEENRYGQLNNECNIQKSQLRQFEKKTQELQNLLDKERNSSYNTIQNLQNEKNQYENQIAQLKCKVDHNQEERDHFQSANQQLEEKNKCLERTIKDNKKEIENLNKELRQFNEEINDIKKQMLIERQKCENKEKEIAQLKNGKAKLQNENHDLKMSLNLLQKEDRNFDQSYETQKSRDQSPFLQQGSNKKSRNNSVTSLQKQSQYNNKSPENRSQRK